MSHDNMRQLPQIQSTLTLLLWTVVLDRHNLFCKDSLVSNIYPMMSGKQFVNALEDNIHRRHAMDKLISDSD